VEAAHDPAGGHRAAPHRLTATTEAVPVGRAAAGARGSRDSDADDPHRPPPDGEVDHLREVLGLDHAPAPEACPAVRPR
jgi:hypothetical protein